MFKALVIENDAQQGYRAELRDMDESHLPKGDVTVRVDYSSLNYKDGLAITGKKPIVRSFPMVPGIDFAGVVEESRNPAYRKGDMVFLNGWGLGETRWGGLAQKVRVNGEWLTRLPEKISAKDAMAIGTAGYTAMLAVMALEKNGITPDKGPVLVTGASGGVGSFATAFFSRLGYQVTASTGRPDSEYLVKKLGAAEIINRTTLSTRGNPLMKERWAGAIDSVGGQTLVSVCASIMYGGAVAACGMAESLDFPGSVAPFILRGISLAGIDSVKCPVEKRNAAWRRMAEIVDPVLLEEISHEIRLEEVLDTIPELMGGRIKGRVVVRVD
ncbi:oxidoreductase [Oxalobacter vibrioformis]|uniref:Oxidoreductase n=1 Tax=Oxalobacter vibrioformis TaxID=933080 RepID=A0A9E9LXN8_9BURK|nr:MDR family oxidoreductase [Oxalobacter vibrioformis]WAW10181.1 oxidoreductase [Oxalobacter vibrioformis]